MNELGLWGSGRNGSPASGTPSTRFYPYLVRDKTIDQSSQVSAADVAAHTDAAGVFISRRDHRLGSPAGAVLAAVKHANGGFCVEALSEALARFDIPGIFNTDQSLSSRKRGRAIH